MTIKTHKTGPGTLTFGETGTPVEWGSQVRSCTITPSVDKEDPTEVLSGEKLGGARTETYTLGGSILQSFDLESLLLWAHLNAGQDVPFTFTPNSSQELGVKGIVTVERIPIGGDVDEKRPTSDFEFDGVPGEQAPYDLINSAGDILTEYPGTTGTGGA